MSWTFTNCYIVRRNRRFVNIQEERQLTGIKSIMILGAPQGGGLVGAPIKCSIVLLVALFGFAKYWFKLHFLTRG